MFIEIIFCKASHGEQITTGENSAELTNMRSAGRSLVTQAGRSLVTQAGRTLKVPW